MQNIWPLTPSQEWMAGHRLLKISTPGPSGSPFNHCPGQRVQPRVPCACQASFMRARGHLTKPFPGLSASSACAVDVLSSFAKGLGHARAFLIPAPRKLLEEQGAPNRLVWSGSWEGWGIPALPSFYLNFFSRGTFVSFRTLAHHCK